MNFKPDKTSFLYLLKASIFQAAVAVVGKRGIKPEQIILDHPENPDHGDYSTNIALRLKRPEEFPSAWDFANAIVNAWRTVGLAAYVGRVEVVQPGFINIWLQNDVLINQLSEVLRKKDKFGQSESLKGKKILLEHTSPNPQTTIMLGHLRNNFLGMTMTNILTALGVKVTRDCIVNDRGVHLCRAIWGYLVFGRKKSGLVKAAILDFKNITETDLKKAISGIKWQDLLGEWQKKKSAWYQPKDLKLKPDHANLIWYVLGSQAYELSEKVKKQVEEILVAWETEAEACPSKSCIAERSGVRRIWQQILVWSAKGYEQTYQRIGSIHDWVWHESDHYQEGKEIVELGLKKKVFRKSEGAIVTDLSRCNLSDTVVAKSDGTALYLTQDLALTRLKMSKFPSDLYIWDIGMEQTLYFKQLFAICEQLGFADKDKLFHLAYALINFKGGGKMATRKGDVVKADEILDELKSRALEIIKSSNQELRGKLSKNQLNELAEKVAVGAIKYSLLKFSRETTIYFDIDESLALEGNSGPYLQYTFSRCQSVLNKSKKTSFAPGTIEKLSDLNISSLEILLLRTIFHFPEVILEAGKSYAPNMICNYLFDLAQKYNLFYNKYPIIKAKPAKLADFRLSLTAAVGQIVKNGLTLLGIETPRKM